MASSIASSTVNMTSKQLRRSMPLMDRFLVREMRLKEQIETIGGGKVENLSALRESVINPNPFKTYRNPFSKKWIPARLSLRRQAQLGKHAFANGRFDELIGEVDRLNLGNKRLAGTKLNKMRERIAELRQQEEDSFKVESEAESPSIIAQNKINQQQTPEQLIRLAKALASSHGPYRGRSENKIFKGTLQQRQAPRKRQNILDKMEKMDQTISDWRRIKKDNKTKALPKLPF